MACMKVKIKRNKMKYIYILFIAYLMVSCGVDNYDEPEVVLSGNVVYNGKNVQVMGSNGTVQMELYQDGYELNNKPLILYVKQDGSFQTKLYNGNYKLVTKRGTGPWVNSADTLHVNISGSTSCEYPVTPYFTISGESISLNGNTLTATFTINDITGTEVIERAMLLVNKTTFVDETAQIQRADVTYPGGGSVTMSMELSGETLAFPVLNARIGIKREGEQAIYCPVTKIK